MLPSSLSPIMTGKRQPTLEQLRKISGALDVPIWILMMLEERGVDEPWVSDIGPGGLWQRQAPVESVAVEKVEGTIHSLRQGFRHLAREWMRLRNAVFGGPKTEQCKLLGELLVDLGYVNQEQVDEAVRIQNGQDEGKAR